MTDNNTQCPGPVDFAALRVHIESLSDWLFRTYEVMGAVDSEHPTGWSSVQNWLRMAAGLRRVEIDLSTFGAFMCNGAEEYENAVGEATSRQHAYLTRLLYLYMAIENATSTIDPRADGDGKTFPIAQSILARHREGLFRHETCAHVHVMKHVRLDAQLSESKLSTVSLENPQYPGLPSLQIAARFRNLYAHGGLQTPILRRRRADNSWDPDPGRRSCAIDYACRCILFTLQRLFIVALQKNLLTSEVKEFYVVGGEGLGGDDPELTFDNEQYLRNIHLAYEVDREYL